MNAAIALQGQEVLSGGDKSVPLCCSSGQQFVPQQGEGWGFLQVCVCLLQSELSDPYSRGWDPGLPNPCSLP